MAEIVCKKCGSLEHITRNVIFKDKTSHVAADCKDCGAFIQYLSQGLPPKFYFGKYKGKEFKDVPKDYLRWALENIKQVNLQNKIREYLKEAE
jgi:hypothetical protein